MTSADAMRHVARMMLEMAALIDDDPEAAATLEDGAQEVLLLLGEDG